MAHAVDGAEHGVGPTENPSEPPGAFIHTAVVVDELAVGLLDEVSEVSDEPRPASDVRDASSAEVEQWTGSVRSRGAGAKHEIEGLALRSEVPDAHVQVVPCASQLRGLALELNPSPAFRMTGPGRVFELALKDLDPRLELSVGITPAERMDPGLRLGQLLLGCS